MKINWWTLLGPLILGVCCYALRLPYPATLTLLAVYGFFAMDFRRGQ